MSILEAEGEPQASDERQGQILAGNYVGYPNAVAGAVTTPGYLTWLENRGLRTTINPQTVAIFDTGYDDGSGSPGAHHPDLENPERLIATEAEATFVFNRTLPIEDTFGHGTAVAGIIAGNGAAALPNPGNKDAQEG
jgi:subtilisin family serine protease